MNRVLPLIGAAALAAALGACSHEPAKPILDPAKAREAYAVGQRLAAQDRADTARHRAEMSRLIAASVSQTRDAGRTISLYVHLHNRSAKAIRSVEAGLEVHDSTGKRIGLTEIGIRKPIAGHGTLAFWYPLRYVRFSEDAGTMRLAAGKPKTIQMNVTEIKYADGTDAGYDD
ncbi:MAG TPA: hypothetical protein VFN37_10020 [Candidatus Baltobacteraceae bacterium]|nr:hypothetical protein [Candidatus Baltobacteraceae bacterium]